MTISCTAGPDSETGLMIIPAGVQPAKPIVIQSLPYKKIKLFVHERAIAKIRVAEAFEELTIITHSHAQCVVENFITCSGRKEIVIRLEGEHARVDLTSVCVLHADERVELVVRQEHYVAHTHSFVEIKSVLGGRALLKHHGMIFIAHGADRASAHHHSKTILLSCDSFVDSSPDLEVLQQNVQCSHGTAVGPLEQEQILYLSSRGIASREVQRLLVYAFLNVQDRDEAGELRELIAKLQEIV
jgi:Fe-S cluster assembly scaffold protein SufB